MITVKVFKQANYPVSTPKLKKHLREFLAKKGIVSEAEVSLALVGKEKMLRLAKDYLKENRKLHNVLSFPSSEARSKFLNPEKILDLGEIVVCYPLAFAEARQESKLLEEKVKELVEHGAWHLLGIHYQQS